VILLLVTNVVTRSELEHRTGDGRWAALLVLAALVGLGFMIAALVIWLVRSFRNRRAHPLAPAPADA
jgi:predicted transporter